MTAVDADRTTEIEVVEAFLRALEELDVDAALACCHADVTYQNVPLPPARGKAATAKQLRLLERCSGFQAITHHIAANDGVVLTERTDIIEMGRFKPAFWVCGTFVVRDGLIVSWTDRFDYAHVTVAVLKAAAKALFRA